jgi:hypothetical protein
MRADPDVPHLSDIYVCDAATHTALYSLISRFYRFKQNVEVNIEAKIEIKIEAKTIKRQYTPLTAIV